MTPFKPGDVVAGDARLIHHRIGRLHSEDAQLVVQAWQRMAAEFAAAAVK